MKSVLLDFQTRSREVEGYFRFVLSMAEQELALKTDDGNDSYTTHEKEELLKTLKATCYLLLYNLVESTMRNAIEAIFAELQTQGTSFDDCREELRREILKNFRRRDPDRLLPRLLTLARDIVHETFNVSELFSGNLDADGIRQTAKRFGFAAPEEKKFWKLQTVKNLRNDLAHGVKSFADVGRDTSSSDLKDARTQVVEILTGTLDNIQSYLSQKNYIISKKR